MALVVDAGPLYAQANRAEPRHEAVLAAIDGERGALVTTEAAAQEADYLIGAHLGIDVELAFLDDLAEGAFQVECLSASERGEARDVAYRYRDLGLGLADASLVVLARRFHTTRILTFDERAFRTVKPLQGGAFVVLPADV